MIVEDSFICFWAIVQPNRTTAAQLTELENQCSEETVKDAEGGV